MRGGAAQRGGRVGAGATRLANKNALDQELDSYMSKRGQQAGASRGGRGGKGNRGGPVPSQAALDAEMDAYMAKRLANPQASAGQPSASVDFDNDDDVGNLGVLGE